MSGPSWRDRSSYGEAPGAFLDIERSFILVFEGYDYTVRLQESIEVLTTGFSSWVEYYIIDFESEDPDRSLASDQESRHNSR